jgi:diguanylate cyclase (GGDEF)-like protein
MSVAEVQRSSILIIDDDKQVRELLGNLLAEGHSCVMADSAEDALQMLKEKKFDLVLSDINMGGISGLELVPYVVRENPETVVIMISGRQTIETAIEAMRVGAFDYITKPFAIPQVEAAVSRGLSHHDLLEAKRRYENELEQLVRERTAEVERLAYFDQLTKLPNRALFEDRLTQAIKQAEVAHQKLAAVLLRVDDFQKISETLGHAISDRLLQEVAKRLNQKLAERITVARFEGDEFALLLTDVAGPEIVVDTLRKIVEAMKATFVFDEHELYLTASIGVSLFDVDGDDTLQLLKHAAIAVNRATSNGGNCYQFYRADMNAQAIKRLGRETEMRRALENDELRLYYQPQLDLGSLRIVGAEALIRWQHPRLGFLPPAEFIPMAEDSDLILLIGEWVLRTACNQLAEWNKAGLHDLRIGLNVSPRQFRERDFQRIVARSLAESSIDPSMIELEITETSIMGPAEEIVTLLRDLKEMGLSIAIDDFGMGYSSLSYLKRLPIDMLKIDRTFVNDSTNDSDAASLVLTIITLAHNLRMKVMAEGVETEGQLQLLRLLRCDEAQGFLFDKPLEPKAFFLKAMSRNPYAETETQLSLVR